MPSDSTIAPWTATQTREQFRAIAALRWHIFLNSFRRKGGTGELIGRILLYPVLAGFAIGPSAAVGVLAGIFTHKEIIADVAWLLWATFAYCQLLNIQLGQPGSTFDPTELIRFPLRAREYVYIRLCFGLLSPANVIGTLMSFSIALGILIAKPSLWFYALAALAIFAAANVLFSRMVFAWVDRWLATRRAREIFTGLIFAFSIGVQWANFTFNPAYNHVKTHSVSPATMQVAMSVVHHATPVLAWLPPQLTASALVAANSSNSGRSLELILACMLYAVAFYIVFAFRMRAEFRGESLSDAANAVSRPSKSAKQSTSASADAARVHDTAVSTVPTRNLLGLSSPVIGILGKEFLYIRRHTGILYGLVMPILVVLFVAFKYANPGNVTWVFPAVVAYCLLAVSNFSYNAFGLEGTGSQFYFLAPVRLRDVLLAKNIASFLTAFIEVALIFLVICVAAGVPQLDIALAAVLWAVATLLLTTSMGNRRSITAPKKVTTGRMGNKQISQLSALISMGILTGSILIAAGPTALALYLHHTWILLPSAVLYAAVGAFVYERGLRSIDQFALAHREELFAELCKAS
jgi:ABC-2 type transport system permease protein